MTPSVRLTQLTKAALEPVGELIQKETAFTVHFQAKKTSCEVEIIAKTGWGQFRAAADAHDFLAAVSAVTHRLEKQILKKKSKLQDHKAA